MIRRRHLNAPLLALACLAASGCGLGGLVGGIFASTLDDGSDDHHPAPSISAASPTSGTHAGGSQITITGEHFTGDAAGGGPLVSINGVEATGVVLHDSTRLTATVPASSMVGAASITVTNPTGGSATLANGYTYTNAPPTATIEDLSSPQSLNIVFTVILTDPESDLIDLRLESSTNGGPWQPVPSSQILSGGTNSLTSSPNGVRHNLTWDSRGAFASDNAQVRLRVTPVDRSDQQDGAAGTSNQFEVTNNTPVDVVLQQPGDDSFEVVFSYAVADPDAGDPVVVSALTWRNVNTGAAGPLTLKAGQGTGSVPFSSAGLLVDSVWDSLTDLGYGNNHLVELTVTVGDGAFSRTRTTQPFFVHNGPLSQTVSASTQLLSAGYAVGDVASPTRKLVHGAVAGGSFVLGETVTGGTSGRTAVVDRLGDGFLLVREENGAFALGETITGGSSGASTPLTALQPFPPLPDLVGCAQLGPGAPGRIAVVKSNGLGFDSPLIFLAPNIPGLPIPGSSTNIFLSGYAHPGECAVLDVDGDGLSDLVAATHRGNDSSGPGIPGLVADAGADAGTGFANVRAHQVTLTAKQVNGALQIGAGTYESNQADRAAIAPHVRVTGQAASAYPPAATGNPSLDFIGWFGGDVVAADVSAPGTASRGHPDLVVLHRVRQLGSAFGGDLRGAVVIREYDPAGKQLLAPVYLDPSDIGVLPVQVAVADITSDAHTAANGGLPGDGRDVPADTPDMILANQGDSSLTFYLQVGPASSPPTYVSCKLALAALVPGLPAGDVNGVAIGDLNGDGFNDFVVVGQMSKQLYVFVHDRDATANGTLLTQPTTYGLLPFRLAGALPLPAAGGRSPAIADFSGDGKADIVVPLSLTNEVVLFVNYASFAGTPVFGPPPGYSPAAIRFPTNFGATQSLVADMNGDGTSDLIVGTANSAASVLYQTTPGTLDPAVPIPTGNSPAALAAGDMTGDGVPNLAVPLQGDNTLLRLRRGTGSLLEVDATIDLTAYADPSPPTLAVSTPQAVSFVDLSGDGNRDSLLVSQFAVAGAGGTFGGWSRMPAGGASVAAVRTTVKTITHPAGLYAHAGDVLYSGGTPDGVPDVVVGTAGGLQVWRGLGGQTFASSPTVLASTMIISDARVLDLDGDGHLDVVGAVNQRGIAVFYNGGHPAGSIAYGTLPATPVLLDLQGVPSASYFEAADVGGPGSRPDLVFANYNGAGAGVLYQTSARTFQTVLLSSGGEPGQVAIGDLNGDGLADIAIPWGTDNLLAVYYRNPAAAGLADNFKAPALFPTAQNPLGATTLDVDGDGRTDVVVSCRGANVLNVFRQR